VPDPAATDQLHVRRLEPADLAFAGELAAAAFGHDIGEDLARRRWQERLAFPLATDPDGGFVAERDGRLLGVAHAIRRERLWVLSMLAVDPALQSAGAGRALLEHALGYSAGTEAGLIVSSSDPRALRLYGLAGFSLRPTFAAHGHPERRALPRLDPTVQEADGTELEELAAISREVRGAPHTAEVEFALARGGRLLRYTDRGFVVTLPNHGVWLLAARNENAARALLWRGLELVGDVEPDRPIVRWITGGQDWAIDVLLRAGYTLVPRGALCVRGQPGPLRPFIPSPPFA
jgi:ribosomal protein S18 acetylase RimI-like enzyme